MFEVDRYDKIIVHLIFRYQCVMLNFFVKYMDSLFINL